MQAVPQETGAENISGGVQNRNLLCPNFPLFLLPIDLGAPQENNVPG
jgi:hypothetical protein